MTYDFISSFSLFSLRTSNDLASDLPLLSCRESRGECDTSRPANLLPSLRGSSRRSAPVNYAPRRECTRLLQNHSSSERARLYEQRNSVSSAWSCKHARTLPASADSPSAARASSISANWQSVAARAISISGAECVAVFGRAD